MRGLAVADGGSFLPDFASDNRLIHRHKGAGFYFFCSFYLWYYYFIRKEKKFPKLDCAIIIFSPQKNPNKNNKKIKKP